jgi:hypothetical protein
MDETPQQIPNQPVEPQPQPEQQVPVQSEQPVMTPQQPQTRWLFLVLALVVALAVYAGVAYWQGVWPFSEEMIIEGSPKPTPTLAPGTITPTPTLDPTVNWETYRNNEYGFEVKYPRDWDTIDDITLMTEFGQLSFFLARGLALDVWDMSVYTYDQLKEAPPGGVVDVSEKSIIVDSYPATEISYVSIGDAGSGSSPGKKVSILKEGLVYRIKCNGEECIQIISTFRFTN